MHINNLAICFIAIFLLPSMWLLIIFIVWFAQLIIIMISPGGFFPSHNYYPNRISIALVYTFLNFASIEMFICHLYYWPIIFAC